MKSIKRHERHLNYDKHLLILASVVAGCVSIFGFASLVCPPVGNVISALGIKICAITAGVKKYKSIIKKKKKHNKIVLLRKDKFNAIEVLVSKALIESYISHDEFIPVNNVLRKCNEIKAEIKNLI